ncbi:MAG: protein translocase subunit SecF, partial [Microcystaceae cyanobacterium]
GLDFIGGTRLQLQLVCASQKNCAKPIDIAEVRTVLDQEGLGGSSLQVIEDYMLSIRSKTLDTDQRSQVQKALNDKIGQFDPETIQIDTVGPTVGQELFTSGILAVIL